MSGQPNTQTINFQSTKLKLAAWNCYIEDKVQTQWTFYNRGFYWLTVEIDSLSLSK